MSSSHFARCQTDAMIIFSIVFLASALLPSRATFAQGDLRKRPLEHTDYEAWKTLKQTNISRDGKWVMYRTQKGVLDGETTLTIRNTTNAKEYRIQRGTDGQISFDSRFAFYYLTPAKKTPLPKKESDKEASDTRSERKLKILELSSGNTITIERLKSLSLPSKSGTWAAWLLKSPVDNEKVVDNISEIQEIYEVTSTGIRRPKKKLKLKKREFEQKNSESEVPSETNNKQTLKSNGELAETEKSNNTKKEEDSEDDDKEKKKTGTQLILHNLQHGTQLTFPNVVSCEFSKHGDAFAFVTSTKIETSKSKNKPKEVPPEESRIDKKVEPDSTNQGLDGVTVIDLKSLQITKIASGIGQYRNLAFNEDGSQLTFITDRDDHDSQTPTWSLYHWHSPLEKAAQVATEGKSGIPESWWIAPHSDLRFSEDGKRLYFETAPIPDDVIKERTEKSSGDTANKKEEEEEEKAKLDLWHWQDPQLQPEQLLRASAERKRDYRAVYLIQSQKIVQLANQKIPNIRIDMRSNSNLAVANSNLRYRKMRSWESPGYQDVYSVNLDTGERQLLLERVRLTGSLSPEGKFITWFDAEQKKWFSISTNEEEPNPVEISAGIEFPLQDEMHDTPNLASAYGMAGWLTKDHALLIYDRYDIWQLDPTGQTQPINLTKGWGRANNIRLRYIRLDAEQRAIDREQTMLLSAFNQQTKASGYFSLTLEPKNNDNTASGDSEKNNPLQQLIMLNENISGLQKAELSDDLVFIRNSFRECKDIWKTDIDFEKIHRISDINPQQEKYSWGTAELVHWKSEDGQLLDGILYKPEGFDPNKKYPMIVNFYERNSDRLHKYFTPAPGRSSICHSFYVSRGYLVFVPDIPYKTGEPGPSAAKAILPGIQNLINQGFVDPKRIGTQGHSWGGYQVAYLISQTNMFACAESGAPVSNMTSAYGGIRWSTGLSRMFQYERTQSRIGADLWTAREKYIANSPLFFANKINTPLLILHNDQDGAVPWYQGIELFVAMRRLEKPAWMLNYNNNPHWVKGNANRRDFAIRMQQFFDHYLKDAPEPQWMAVGIPAVDKGKQFGLELLEPKKESPKEKAARDQLKTTNKFPLTSQFRNQAFNSNIDFAPGIRRVSCANR